MQRTDDDVWRDYVQDKHKKYSKSKRVNCTRYRYILYPGENRVLKINTLKFLVDIDIIPKV